MKATTYKGLEDVLGRELIRMGAEDVETLDCAVTFKGDKYLLYRANYELRTAIKIYTEILSFEFSSREEMIKNLSDYRWSKILNIYKSYRVEGTCKSDVLGADTDILVEVYDLIADYFSKKSKKTPPKDQSNPAVIITLEVIDNKFVMMLDSSATPLYRRGYTTQGENKLNSVFAAGLIQLSGWKALTNLYIPFCGEGTLAMEAAMLAYNIPAGYGRESFGFFSWRDFDQKLWQDIKEDARLEVKRNGDFIYKIIASDKNENVIKQANQNISKAVLDKYITVQNVSLNGLEVSGKFNTLLLNINFADYSFKKDEAKKYFEQIGQTLKKNFAGQKAWIHSNYPDLYKALNITPKKEAEIFDGVTPSVYAMFEL